MMLAQILDDCDVRFRTQSEADEELAALCEKHSDTGTAVAIGASEQGRELRGYLIGRGAKHVSLIAGCHSDEPVGPETLRHLVAGLLVQSAELAQLLSRFTLVVVPHVNPDGEAVNRPWIEAWPDVESYVEQVFRELPGRDVEFAFPDRRVENQAVSDFLGQFGPFDAHASLHGMGFADGILLLIERHWGFRTDHLQETFRTLAAEAGLSLHDNNRRGEKGFFYLGPGFNTTPEGEAMRTYFRSLGDEGMASQFGQSSMEYVRSLGGDPLCVVTELPLFLIDRIGEGDRPGYPAGYLRFKDELKAARASGDRARLSALLEEFNVRPFALESMMRIQLRILEAMLQEVSARESQNRLLLDGD